MLLLPEVVPGAEDRPPVDGLVDALVERLEVGDNRAGEVKVERLEGRHGREVGVRGGGGSVDKGGVERELALDGEREEERRGGGRAGGEEHVRPAFRTDVPFPLL